MCNAFDSAPRTVATTGSDNSFAGSAGPTRSGRSILRKWHDNAYARQIDSVTFFNVGKLLLAALFGARDVESAQCSSNINSATADIRFAIFGLPIPLELGERLQTSD